MQLWRLLPGLCALCRSKTGHGLDLCAPCRADLTLNTGACQRCGRPTPRLDGECPACLVTPPPQTRTVAPFTYTPPMTRLIHGLKRGNGLLEARVLAELMAPAVLADPPPDVLTPVPLSWRRRVARGYNQAALLAARLGRLVGVPVDYRSLKRTRHTPPQQSLDARTRRRNLRNAFQASAAVAGRDVALVDDVLTTGATTEAAALALLAAGAGNVRVWTAAHTPLT